MPRKDGHNLESQYARVKKLKGETPIEARRPEFPFLLRYLWDIFFELNGTRPHGFDGPLQITYSEIKCFSELKGIVLKPWEVDVIKKIDYIYLEVVSEIRSSQ